MYKSLLCIILFFLGYVATSNSQPAYFTKYTEKDGLSSNHVYKVFQDSKGYMWMATSKGVTRYDGENFKVFGTTDGLTDYEIISIYEDSSARIWFATFNGLPCYFQNGEIYNFENDPLLKNIEAKGYIKNIFEDSNQNIWLTTKFKAIQLDYNKNEVKQHYINSYLIHENKDKDIIFHLQMNQQVNINKDKDEVEYVPLGRNTEPTLLSGISGNAILKDVGLLFAIQNRIYLKPLEYDSIYEIKTDPIFTPNTAIRNIKEDENKDIYVATTEGAYIYRLDFKNRKFILKKTYFEGRSITSFNVDHQRGIWISSQNGVYHYKNDEVLHLNNEIGSANLLNKNEKYIVVGESSNKISILDINTAEIIKAFVTDTELKSIEHVNGDLYLITENGVYKIVGNSFEEIRFNHSAKDIEIANNKYILGTHSGIFVVDREILDNDLLDNGRLADNENVELIYDERVFKLFKIGKHIYASTVEGTLIYDEELTRIDKNISTSNFRPNDIIAFKDKIVISTYQDGVYTYDKEDNIHITNTEVGLISNEVIKTLQYKDRLYVVTGRGVQYLDEEMKPTNVFGLTNLETKINGAELLGDNLILATSDGILSYNLNTNIVRDEVYRSDIVIRQNGDRISNLDTLEFSNNSIEIQFQVFDFAKIHEDLSYRLYPENKDWKPVNAKQILYQGLQPNTYVFQLKAGDRAVDEVTFHIKKPIWKELWFKVLAGMLLLGLVYYFLRLRFVKALKKKEETFAFNLKLATAEQEALKAQMNPHFIFNALNAIQNLILNERTSQAYKYLGDFSKLVRKVLLDSRNINTTVKKEIEFLTLYMQLEELRFEDRFNFTFEYDKEFNVNQVIPSMVLQPFVENAILHGLIPQEDNENPEIKILFEEDNSFLYCQIWDNGVGFDPNTHSKISNESLGLKIITERLELYDPSGQSQFAVKSSEEGTKIKLQLKKLNESNHN